MNGSGSKDENEPPLNGVLLGINRMTSDTTERVRTNFSQIELMSNRDGEIKYYNLTEGTYEISITPAINVVYLYSVNGSRQEVIVSQNMTYYIPFTQSYKVSGKLIVIRDEFSSAGKIDLANIRVSATSSSGQTFSTLTDKSGSYTLNVPQSCFYTLSISNIIGGNFELENDEFMLDSNGMKTYTVDIKLVEKKRKISFNNNTGQNTGLPLIRSLQPPTQGTGTASSATPPIPSVALPPANAAQPPPEANTPVSQQCAAFILLFWR